MQHQRKRFQIQVMKADENKKGVMFAVKSDQQDGPQLSMAVKESAACIAAEIHFSWPLLDICGIWYPNCGKDRALQMESACLKKCMTCVSAPVICLYDEKGTNRLTFALEEAAKEVRFGAGVREEDGTLRCTVNFRLTREELPYQTELYLEWEDEHFSKALENVAVWWEKDCKMTPMDVPEAARLPMYSTWYSFHQNIRADELEKEAVLAKGAGFQTLIVDDGWQTEDNGRGYAFCGDWKAAEKKIPDMKEHVKKIHELGMKYMLWFSVPFVGDRSEAWKQFAEKLLYYDGRRRAGVLDIRYPEVREYLLNFYRRAVKEWDIDGLKLDFVDEFYTREEKPVPWKEGMDFLRVENALLTFLEQVRAELQKIKREVMIEFRQWYVGPHMRRFGNMIRVADCPESAMSNRIGSVDIRLLARKTAVHSDMIMWHEREKAEDAARQIIHSIFANLQLSVKLEEQSAQNRKMIAFWTQFSTQKKDILQEGKLIPEEPQNLYPAVTAAGNGEAVTAVYSADRKVLIRKEFTRHTVINGVKQKQLILEIEKEGRYHICRRNCQGEVLWEGDKILKRGLTVLPVTPSGLIEFERF